MPQLRHRFASVLAVAIASGLYACGDGVTLPQDGEPAELLIVSGNTQSGPAGEPLAQELVVRVRDRDEFPVANQGVQFVIEAGDGTITPATASTNSQGTASAVWRLGPTAGEQRVRASATGASDDLVVSFTATAISGSAGSLVILSGDGQVGGVNSSLAQPLVVQVRDALGNGVAGMTVNWTADGGGTIDPASNLTGPDGTASAQRVLGPTAGPQSAQAAVPGLANSPVTFTHTADASTPADLELVSGNDQSAPAGFQLPDSLVVRLLDDNGNGVGGRSVTWVVPSSAGAVNPVNSVTTPEGFAVTRWTLGATAGMYTISAVFSGLEPVQFSARATSDAPTTIALLDGNSQTGAVGSTLDDPLRVRVTDANGNPVENVSVTWAAVGGAQVSSTTTGTDGQGIAAVGLTLGAAPGTYTTTATVDGLTGSPVTFTSIAEVGRASRLAILSQPGSALVGQSLQPVTVEVQDAQGNRVSDATNRITISTSPLAALEGDNQVDAVGGIATFSGLSINRAGTGFRLTARASTLSDAVTDPFDIGQGATTITITGRTPSPSVTGQSVTISFDIDVVAPAEGTLSGNVQVSDGTQSCTTGSYNFTTGTGSCVIAFASAGDHNLTATYAGNANFTGSASAAVTHTVNRATTVVNIGSLAQSVAGQPLTVPFTVTATQGGTPTGDVTVTLSGGPENCTAPVAQGSCQLTPLVGGPRTVTATYPGNANFAPDDDSENIVIRNPTTTTVTTSDPSTVFGENVTFTATVTLQPPATGTASGTVQFRADGAALGGPASMTGGVATRTTSALSVGMHVITAEYIPGGLQSGASTGTLSGGQNVNQATTTTTITGANPEPSDPGASYTVSVTVAPQVAGVAPDGSVSISDSEGGGCTATLSGGSGSCAMSTATPGTKTLSATYGGSASFLGSAGTAPHRVNAPPTASPDAYSGMGLFFFQAAPGVLLNDGDPDGMDGVTAVLDSDNSNGQLTLGEDGSIAFLPDAGFTGGSFTYHAFDGSLSSPSVTVTLSP